MDETNRILQQQFKKLPEDIQELLHSDVFEKQLAQVGNRHTLTEDQITALSNEVILALLGLDTFEDLEENLGEVLEISPDKVEILIDDVYTTILVPVTPSLQKFLTLQLKKESEDLERMRTYANNFKGKSLLNAISTPKRKEQKTLPKEIQNVLTSVEAGEFIRKLGAKYNLQVDQLGELYNQVGLVLLGLTPHDTFAEKLKSTLSVDEKTVGEIVTLLDKGIFAPIRSQLVGPPQTLQGQTETHTPQENGAERQREKTRPAGPDPYREPIE